MVLRDKPLPEGLFLTGANLGDEDLLMLTGFDAVPLLNVSRTKVTENGLLKFRAFKNLKDLYLYGIKISPAAAGQLKRSRPGLSVHTEFN
jgi:hypothetical protein